MPKQELFLVNQTLHKNNPGPAGSIEVDWYRQRKVLGKHQKADVPATVSVSTKEVDQKKITIDEIDAYSTRATWKRCRILDDPDNAAQDNPEERTPSPVWPPVRA